jgi:hypothetical protein
MMTSPQRQSRGTIRNSFHSLLHRSSRRDLSPDTAIERIAKAKNVHDFLQAGVHISQKTPVPAADKRGSFTVVRARVYTKGERNDFHYSPLLAARLPIIKVDPPDNLPYQLPSALETLRLDDPPTPPASPKIGAKRPVLSIPSAASLPSSTPPSPPASPTSLPASPTRAPPPPPSTHTPLLTASDDIIIQIFTHSPDISSAAALAATHPRLQAIFSGSRYFILRRILATTSPANFRVLEILRPDGGYTADSYIEYYAVSIDTVSEIRILIRARCRFLLSASDSELEEALFNVWAFCLQFSPSSPRREDGRRSREEKWLRSFSMRSMHIMLEVWNCLAYLLRPFLLAPKLARAYGVVDSPEGTVEDEIKAHQQLEDFIAYLQTRGLETLLPILRWGEDDHNQRYAIIAAKGLNRWHKEEGEKYRGFLKEAVKKVYKEKSLKEMKTAKVSPCKSWGPTFEF